MRKLMMLACMILCNLVMYAEQGDKAFGVNLNYGLHSDYKNLGLGVKGQYEFIDNVRGEASFNYYLKKDNVSMWELNANVHYLFRITDEVTLYPLAGLTMLTAKVESANFGGIKSSASDTNIGLNLGAGIEYPLSDSVKLNGEIKYQIVNDFDRPVISVGLTFAL